MPVLDGPAASAGDALLRDWVEALGAGAAVVAAGRELLARYAEPHRRYHDQRHLEDVLQALRALTGGARPPRPVVLAAYWHDAVYDPPADDNEERSARLAIATLARLGVDRGEVDEVGRLVRSTQAHDPAPDDLGAALLSDADLAVLARSAERYLAYAAEVRREYGHLDDAAFRRGRTAVLQALLDRPALFTTPDARRRWETPARRNLRAERARLAAAPPPSGA